MFSQGLKKVLSSCLRQVSSPSEHIIFCLPTKSFNEQTKTCSGQAKFKSYLSQGQAGIQVLNPVLWMPNQEYVSCIRMIFRPKISAHLLNIIACFFDRKRGVRSRSQHNTQFPITKFKLTKHIL